MNITIKVNLFDHETVQDMDYLGVKLCYPTPNIVQDITINILE